MYINNGGFLFLNFEYSILCIVYVGVNLDIWENLLNGIRCV